MLTVKTKIGPSKINGIGLFADQFIPKGSIIWEFKKGFDVLVPKKDLKELSPAALEQFHHYAFFDNEYDMYILCSDDARFFNHSEKPNCDDSQSNVTVSLSDIHPGEEMTVDYRVFYGNLHEHPEIFDKSEFM